MDTTVASDQAASSAETGSATVPGVAYANRAEPFAEPSEQLIASLPADFR